jgi:hypothetical protein
MADLKGSKTEQHLKAALAAESQANRRYLYFAQKADVEGLRRSRRCSAPSPKVRRVHGSGTSTSSRASVIR